MDLSRDVRAEGVTVLGVGGEVDVHSAPVLSDELNAIFQGDARWLVVDLNQVEFIDSTGLGVLVGGFNMAREQDARFDLACTVERVIKLLRITGLDEVFSIFGTADEAIAAGGRTGG